jgi:hypothetical protein
VVGGLLVVADHAQQRLPSFRGVALAGHHLPQGEGRAVGHQRGDGVLVEELPGGAPLPFHGEIGERIGGPRGAHLLDLAHQRRQLHQVEVAHGDGLREGLAGRAVPELDPTVTAPAGPELPLRDRREGGGDDGHAEGPGEGLHQQASGA